jgi:hypothetical protein
LTGSRYNKGSHPIPFQKEVIGAAVSKKIKSDVVPDVEEVAEASIFHYGEAWLNFDGPVLMDNVTFFFFL